MKSAIYRRTEPSPKSPAGQNSSDGQYRTQRVDVSLALRIQPRPNVAEKKFRRTLLSLKCSIDVPPLQTRRDHIPLLVSYFANKYARRMETN